MSLLVEPWLYHVATTQLPGLEDLPGTFSMAGSLAVPLFMYVICIVLFRESNYGRGY